MHTLCRRLAGHAGIIMKRQFFYQSVAIAALSGICTPLSAADVVMSGGDIQPFKGDIDPFRGDIDPFRGDIDPFRGDINPFRGDIDPFRGDIDPFAGDLNPFRGDIDPFSGDINPFYGDISPFWGDISSFWGDIDPFRGDIDPFTGDIDSFWGDIDPFAVEGLGAYWNHAGAQWGDLNAAWSALGPYQASTQSSYSELRNEFQALINFSSTTWNAAVQAQTGQPMTTAFANPLLAKYGIDLGDASTLANVDAADRARFFLEWYDGLMSFSGSDQVDHWMPAINWTPTLTQDQGNGHDAAIGLLDVAISPSDDNLEYLINVGGYTMSPNEHGAAVASLIAGRHDSKGVLGIAPKATIYAYSPFDDTGSSNFVDVSNGIDALTAAGANVVNMSLGVPGSTFHQDIADIFQGASAQGAADNTVFVIASGNDGIVQTADIDWSDDAVSSNLLIVGSVDPNKKISIFSNTPGEACFVDGGCNETDKLKYHFLVAPGELILVSDNAGGTTRLSGTSFAAPLVTGAVSLLHDRWPWLQQRAEETAQIILSSAQDLGAPGVDAVYGHGLLDVAASQSPLSFDNLVLYQPGAGGNLAQLQASDLKSSLLAPGQLDLWELSGTHIYAYETVGGTHRDFMIPLSTALYGQDGTYNGNTERYQRHIYERLTDWANGTPFAPVNSYRAPIGSYGGWNISMLAAPVSSFTPASQADRPFDSAFMFKTKDQNLTVLIGQGAGALSLTGENGFTQYSDHDPKSGGVNPFLGFASGGAYVKVGAQLAPGLELSFGFSEVENDHSYVDQTTGENSFNDTLFTEYKAKATFAEISYVVATDVRVHAAITHLNEGAGLLGAQGLGALSLDLGSRSNGVTLGATANINPRFSLSASMTAGQTSSNNAGNAVLSVDHKGLKTTAFELAATARSLLKTNDAIKLTFAQPLHVESGALKYESVQVIDRSTGEIGFVDEFWNLGGGNRRFVTEMQYSIPVFNEAADIGLFGRVDIGEVDIDGEFNTFAGGARFNLSF